ncbi:MAG: choice-of-anchor J domain-containing protein [Bacteroidota bacterium]
MKKLFINGIALCLSLYAQSQVEFLISEGFENGFNLPANWNAIDYDGDGNTWGIGDLSGQSFEGSNYIAVKYNPTGNNDDLWSPVFFISNDVDDAFLTFNAKSLDPLYLESFEVRYNNGSNTYLFPAVYAAPASYMQYTFSLNQFKGMAGWIQIKCTSVDKYYLLLDNINIYTVSNASGVKNAEMATFKVYPNPASDFIKIELNTNSKVSISVLTLDSKMIYEGQFDNTNSVEIVSKDWPKGIYYLMVNGKQQMIIKD